MRYRFNAPSHHSLLLGEDQFFGGEEFELPEGFTGDADYRLERLDEEPDTASANVGTSYESYDFKGFEGTDPEDDR